jgi:G3E family GTPase
MDQAVGKAGIDATSDKRTPVVVVTGFLGSGKTTLVNHILRNQQGKKLAVIINEIGEVNLDGQLVLTDENEQIVEFNNGCLCCTVRGDLIEMLGRLSERADKLDGIVIETTGLADPAPVASTFFVSDAVRAAVRLDSFIGVVDAKNIETNLEQSPEAQEQVAFSDIILINKSDLVSPESLAKVTQHIRALNPVARIIHTTQSEVDLDAVLNTGAFELEAKLKVDPEFLGDHEHEHDDRIKSYVLTESRPIDINRFMLWMNDYAQAHGENLLRTKGIFYARGFPERLVFQSVRMLTTLKPERLWREGEERLTTFVVIGRDIDQETFQQALASSAAT